MNPNGSLAALASITVGVAIGVASERMSSPSPVRGCVALVTAWLVGGFVGAILRLIDGHRRSGIVAVSVGLGEVALSLTVLLAAGLALYLVLGALGAFIHLGLPGWRTLVLALFGALAGGRVGSGEAGYNRPVEQR